MKIRTMKVVANPFCALDADGRAQGAVGKEGASGQWIGAQKCHEGTAATGKNIFVFSTDPVTVPYTAYYARKVAEGELIAADLATAKLAGIKEEDFVEPAKLLAGESAYAAKAYRDATGDEPKLLERAVPPKPVEGEQAEAAPAVKPALVRAPYASTLEDADSAR